MRVDTPFDGFRWLTVGPRSQPGVEIVLEAAGMGHPADSETLRALVAKGSLSGVIFQTDDLEGLSEKIRAASARGAPGTDRPTLRRVRLRLP